MAHAPKFVVALNWNGGVEVPGGGIFQALGELAQRGHGGLGHAQHEHEGNEHRERNKRQHVASGLGSRAVGLLVFVGQGGRIQAYHAVGAGPQLVQHQAVGLPPVRSKAGRQAVHKLLLAGLSDIARFAGQARLKPGQAIGAAWLGLQSVQGLQHLLAQLHGVEIGFQNTTGAGFQAPYRIESIPTQGHYQ